MEVQLTRDLSGPNIGLFFAIHQVEDAKSARKAPQAAQQERSRNKACLYCDHHASSPDGKDDSGLSSHSWPRSDAQTPLYNREGCSTWCCDFLLQQKI